MTASQTIRDGFSGTIGNTPLIRLNALSEQTGCEILGKAEFLNPGGSVKDRAALFMIMDAEEKGVLKPGGVVIEGTAGNTGIGLTLVGNARGYRTVIVMPETQSQEKKDMLRLAGAELKLVPAKPYRDPENYVHVSERVAEDLAKTGAHGALWANNGTTPQTLGLTLKQPGRKSGSRLAVRSMALPAPSARAAQSPESAPS